MAQAGFGPVVAEFLPKFAPSTVVFDALILLAPAAALGFIPSIILNSKVVNKQSRHAVVWGVGLAVNALFDVLTIRVLGWGLPGVAWSSVVAQLLISIALFAVAHRYWLGGTLPDARYPSPIV